MRVSLWVFTLLVSHIFLEIFLFYAVMSYSSKRVEEERIIEPDGVAPDIFMSDLQVQYFLPNSSFKEENLKILEEHNEYNIVNDSLGGVYKYWKCPNPEHDYDFFFHFFRGIMEVWKSIAFASDVKWILWYGSLLGSFRDETFIPWDTDVDVIVNIEDVFKLQERIPFFIDDRLTFFVHPDFLHPPENRRILPFSDHCPRCNFDGPVARLMDKETGVILDIFAYRNKGEIWEVEFGRTREFLQKDIFPLKKCNFIGMNCTCPNETKKVLTEIYGDIRRPFECKGGIWSRIKGVKAFEKPDKVEIFEEIEFL